MKKLIGVLLMLVLMASPVFTSPAFGTQKATELANEDLSESSEDTGWLTKYTGTGESGQITYFITMETDGTTVPVTLGVTVQASADGTNWADIKWFDLLGGTTAQVRETIDSDGTYVMWLDQKILAPHVRIKISADAGNWTFPDNVLAGRDDHAGVIVTIVEDK